MVVEEMEVVVDKNKMIRVDDGVDDACAGL